MSLSQDLIDLAIALKAISDGRMDATQAAITKQWVAAWHELSGEWAGALDDLILSAEDDQWPSRAKILRSERALRALRATADRLQELTDASGAEVTGSLDGLLKLAEDHQLRMIGSQFPLDYADWSEARVDPRAMQAIVTRSTATITALSWPIAADIEAAIKSVLIKGVALGENPRKAASDMLKRVGDRFDGGRRRAENIARTEMIDAYRESARQSRIANAAVLVGWRWTAALSDRTCLSCIAMDGKIFPVDEPGPHDHQSGRCVGTPVTPGWQELGADRSGTDWLASQPEAVQRKIMGPARFDAWKAGSFPPEQWAVTKDNPGWRPSVVPGTPGKPGTPAGPATQTGGSGGGSGKPPALPPIGSPDRWPAPDPGRKLTAAEEAHFAARQAALPFRYNGETLTPLEVEFAERMYLRNDTLAWIPKPVPLPGELQKSSNDFWWLSHDKAAWELKSVGSVSYSSAKRQIQDAIREARKHGVVKDHFMIDFRMKPLTEKVRRQLAQYNVRNPGAKVKRLWVLSDDGASLEEIILK